MGGRRGGLSPATASRLLEWQQPWLPEDLCFLHQDGEPALISTTHGGLVTLHLTLRELEDLETSVPGITQMLMTSEGLSCSGLMGPGIE